MYSRQPTEGTRRNDGSHRNLIHTLHIPHQQIHELSLHWNLVSKSIIVTDICAQSADAEWDEAQRLTGQAAEQAQIAQQRKTSAVKYSQTAEEARVAAEDARAKQQQVEV